MKAMGTERVPYFENVGKSVSELNNSVSDIVDKARLNWKVEKRPIYLSGEEEIPNRFATVREDTGEVLGIVGKQYEVVQNKEGFQFVDDCLGKDVKYVR